MINFTTLLNETETLTDLETLESAADLFQFGLDKQYYTLLNTKQFNKTFWATKNRIITNNYCLENKGANYLTTLEIIIPCPIRIKENPKQLKSYVIDIMKNLRGKVA